jgi:hypothetical protein
MRQRRKPAFLGLLGTLLVAHTVFGQPSPLNPASVTIDGPYHGFNVDDHLIDNQQRAAFVPYLYEQLGSVESVGLPTEVSAFFKKVPIVIDPALRGMPGRYDKFNGQWVVEVRPIPMSNQTPIVLHELLHAYHDQVLTMQNPDIINAYKRAKLLSAYPPEFQTAHFQENSKEFFAVIGSIYLFHNIKQPPYDCSIPARTDPVFLAFLAKIFGPHTCN